MRYQILTLCLTLFFVGPNLAAVVGKVNIQKVLLDVKEGKRVRSKLKKQFESKQKKLKTKEDGFKKAQTAFQKQSLVLSDKARDKKGRELQKQYMEIQQLRVKFQKELQASENEAKRPMIEKIQTIIAEVSEKGKFDMIFELSTAPVYMKKATDITGDVIKAYDKKHK